MKVKTIFHFFCVMLAVCVLFSACSQTAWVKGTDESVQTYFPEQTTEKLMEKISSVSYQWALTKEDSNSADIRLEFDILDGKNSYKAKLNGTLLANELSSGKVLWEGPLTGEINIAGKSLSVICSFAKLSGNEKIQVSVTFPAISIDGKALPRLMSFGDDVITEEINQEIQNELNIR